MSDRSADEETSATVKCPGDPGVIHNPIVGICVAAASNANTFR